jgi:exopolyphosphatase/guanosine-5'-triphosphate,3'-diphosphate pyrophosphatase
MDGPVVTHPAGAVGARPSPSGDTWRDLDTLAAIDIGTNSVHMVIARVGEGSTFEVVDRAKEMVRLGSSGGDMKRLEADAIDRGVAALTRFRQLADSYGAPITAVATSAVREAENADEFIRRARNEAGVEVEVISGFEEARLIHLGALQALPIYGRRHFVIDIGGGSTELVLADGVDDGVDDELVRSLKLGAIRLTRRFFAKREGDDEIAACRRFIRSTLSPILRELGGPPAPELAVGASGTVESVVAMVVAQREGEDPRSLNGIEVTRKEVRKVVKSLVKAGSAEERRALPGLEARRADIILAGALVLDEAMEVFELDALTYSDFALREGVLFDAIERARGSARHHLHDLRRRSVLHLVGLCDDDPEHSAHVARLALALFDPVADDLGLTEQHRELLEAAALLCNVGLFISHAQHHKHSYYVIRNSEHLLGFTDHEVELIALTARYHRKSPPKPEHPEFAALRTEDQDVVRKLAAILRVALALDRGHTGAVASVDVEVRPKKVVVEVGAASAVEGALDLELYTANERLPLLAEVLARPVEIRAP